MWAGLSRVTCEALCKEQLSLILVRLSLGMSPKCCTIKNVCCNEL